MKFRIALVTLVAIGLAPLAPAQAATAPPVVVVDTPPLAEVIVVDETHGFDPDGGSTGGVSTQATGTGGTSSASGCGTAWVRNDAHNLLGSLAYRVKSWTRYCWNRSLHKVSSVTNGVVIEALSSQWEYRGVVSSDRHYYSWSAGYPSSGYYNYTMLRFQNCVLKYGCITNDYSRQTVRVHSNGTMYWATDGDT